MSYQNRNAIYMPEKKHVESIFKYIYPAIWFGSFAFIFTIVLVPLASMAGFFPWPFAFLKKGLWVGSCPVCGEALYADLKSDAMESGPFQCPCGAHCRLVGGNEFKYIER